MTMRPSGRAARRAVLPLGVAVALVAGTLAGAARADVTDRQALVASAQPPVATASGSPGPTPLPLSADLAARLHSAAPTDQVAAIAVLRSQADVGGVTGSRRDRLAGIEKRLRDTADAGQRSLLRSLAAARRAGLVTALVPLWIADEVAFTARPAVIRAVAARPDVREVILEQTLQAPSLASRSAVPAAPGVVAADPPAEPNLSRIGAPTLWAQGLRGQGVVVASLDTGVDATHPDLAARWRGGTNSWYDPNGQHPTTPTDVSGHGTQTMGVIVGGAAGGSSIGVAPGATWIAAKIFNDRGTTTTTAVHQAFQWLLDPDHNPATPDAPNVVNNSWTLSTSGCSLEFQPDLRALRSAGIVPVFAAGNFGPVSGSVLTPANLPEALAVGSVDGSDVVDPYSSRGPSACTQGIDPSVSAPGVSIRTTDLYGGYITVGGTSVAAPHAAGALALLLSGAPGTSADRQVAALQSTAVDLGSPGPDNDYGFGRLDAAAAYQWLATAPDFSVTAAPSSASTTAGGTVSFTVTSTPENGFAGDVGLSLSGLTSSQASWSVTPGTIGGGTGTAAVSVTTAGSLAPGSYPLTVTATSGSLSHTVAFTLVVMPPPDFGVAVSPSTLTVGAGGTGAATVTLTSTGGFGGAVALAVSGLPAAVGAATVTPASVTGAGTAQVSVQVAAGATPGSYPLTVTGTSGTLAHSASLTLVVMPPPDFGVAVSPSTLTVGAGGTGAATVTLTSTGGFGGAVALAVSGLPAAVGAATVTPASVTGAGTAQVSVQVAAGATPGSYPLTVTGTSGTLAHGASLTLVVPVASDFSLSASPTSASVARRYSATYTVTVTKIGGFSGAVTMSVTGLPSGASASWSTNPVTGSGTSRLTVRTSLTTPRATSKLTITGTSGALKHQISVTLTVT